MTAPAASYSTIKRYRGRSPGCTQKSRDSSRESVTFFLLLFRNRFASRCSWSAMNGSANDQLQTKTIWSSQHFSSGSKNSEVKNSFEIGCPGYVLRKKKQKRKLSRAWERGHEVVRTDLVTGPADVSRVLATSSSCLFCSSRIRWNRI